MSRCPSGVRCFDELCGGPSTEMIVSCNMTRNWTMFADTNERIWGGSPTLLGDTAAAFPYEHAPLSLLQDKAARKPSLPFLHFYMRCWLRCPEPWSGSEIFPPLILFLCNLLSYNGVKQATQSKIQILPSTYFKVERLVETRWSAEWSESESL